MIKKYEIVGGEYGPTRILFPNKKECVQSLRHLKKEYPNTVWRIVAVQIEGNK